VSSPLLRRRLDGGLLSRLLDDPELLPALQALPAPALRRVILHVGLEDAGELIALASLEQLREVFDEDLWRSTRPGQDEAFDATRFGIWLEVLLEGGEALVADHLAELSEEFLVFAVSQLVWVLDTAVLTQWSVDAREADLLDRILDAHFHQELDEYLLLSRADRAWDALLSSILALDQHHPALLRGILSRCAIATHEQMRSATRLHAALDGEALLLEDARAEREERRAERGYVSPADARAFLALARKAPEPPEEDPITHAHFRERKLVSDPAPAAAAGPSGTTPLRSLLLEAGVEPEGHEAQPAPISLFRQTLAALIECDPHAHQRVIEELAYLSNVLIAGDTSAERPWRPIEAAERVLELCDQGLHALTDGGDLEPSSAREALVRWGAVGVFRIAWASRIASD
jgi:hypothetical protein